MNYQVAFLLSLTISVLSGCSKAQKPLGETSVSKQDRKVLIVYLSRTNNTKAVAEFIREQVGGDIVAIVGKTIGFPTWGMQLPPPMKSFLRQYDLKGKTVIPLNTHAGYGVGSSFTTVKELCPESTILEGIVTNGGIERDGVLMDIKDARPEEVKTEIPTWLKKIKVLR